VKFVFKEKSRINKIVREKGYKLTPQRKATMDVILRNKEKHLSADEIYIKVKEQYPEIGLATVYRTISLLEEIGLLQRLNFDDGRYRYELMQSEENHHHHLVCRDCGKIVEVEEDILEELENIIYRKYKFKVEYHRVQFIGICNNCIK
jgi:Fur family ferric uptake transcriptional regulator